MAFLLLREGVERQWQDRLAGSLPFDMLRVRMTARTKEVL
jgi:hypothetical protein